MDRPRALAALFLLFSSSALSGCYASRERAPESGGPSRIDGALPDARVDAGSDAPTPDDLVAMVVRAWCEELSACPTIAGGERIARVDVELCIEMSPTAAAVRDALGRYADAAHEGVVDFDPSAISGCLEEVARTECAGRTGLVPRPPPHPFSIGEPGFVGSGPRCDAVFPRAARARRG